MSFPSPIITHSTFPRNIIASSTVSIDLWQFAIATWKGRWSREYKQTFQSYETSQSYLTSSVNPYLVICHLHHQLSPLTWRRDHNLTTPTITIRFHTIISSYNFKSMWMNQPSKAIPSQESNRDSQWELREIQSKCDERNFEFNSRAYKNSRSEKILTGKKESLLNSWVMK